MTQWLISILKASIACFRIPIRFDYIKHIYVIVRLYLKAII